MFLRKKKIEIFNRDASLVYIVDVKTAFLLQIRGTKCFQLASGREKYYDTMTQTK